MSLKNKIRKGLAIGSLAGTLAGGTLFIYSIAEMPEIPGKSRELEYNIKSTKTSIEEAKKMIQMIPRLEGRLGNLENEYNQLKYQPNFSQEIERERRLSDLLLYSLVSTLISVPIGIYNWSNLEGKNEQT